MATKTRDLVSSRIEGLLFITLDTVWWETFAALATS
jgi:hypothetical protein